MLNRRLPLERSMQRHARCRKTSRGFSTQPSFFAPRQVREPDLHKTHSRKSSFKEAGPHRMILKGVGRHCFCIREF